jgi:hypothetical protein
MHYTGLWDYSQIELGKPLWYNLLLYIFALVQRTQNRTIWFHFDARNPSARLK